MSLCVISRYYISTVAFFAFHICYTHSFPNVPGKQFEECFQFSRVVENANTVHGLGLALNETKHICSIEGTGGRSFCFVVTSVREGATRSVCHEFDLLASRIWHFTYPIRVLNIVVHRNGNISWCLDCQVFSYDDMKRLYTLMKYNSHERNLRELGRAIDLRKKTGLTADYEAFATTPSIFVDESVEGMESIHIVNSRLGVNEPLLIIWPKSFNIYTSEGRKVFMSLRLFSSDLYYFTCASPEAADQLSNTLGRYSYDGRAIFRSSPVLMI